MTTDEARALLPILLDHEGEYGTLSRAIKATPGVDWLAALPPWELDEDETLTRLRCRIAGVPYAQHGPPDAPEYGPHEPFDRMLRRIYSETLPTLVFSDNPIMKEAEAT